jgi:hypothetical protein
MPKDVRLWKITSYDGLSEITQGKLDIETRLEKWLENDISLVSEELLVIGRQVTTDTGLSIDLLCIDGEGNLVIVELKRQRTPRDVVAQVLDYGSWIQGLSGERVAEIAEAYIKQTNQDSLEQAFMKKFSSELPDILNENHKMIIVASELDPQTERIMHYLSDSYGVAINGLTFQYFKDADGKELIGQTYLIDPKELEKRAEHRTGSKRRPRLSKEELRQIAEDNGVLEIYDKAVEALAPLFDGLDTSANQLALVGKVDGNRRWIFNLLPGRSDSDRGLYYYVYLERISRYFDFTPEEVKAGLPNANDFEIWKGAPPALNGFFTSVEEVCNTADRLSRRV